MKEYDVYLFDADGTIIDTRPLILQSFQHMLGAVDAHCSAEVIQKTVGLPLKRQVRVILGEGREDEYYDRAGEIYSAFMFDNYPGTVKPFPGVVDGLEALRRRGKTLAVVSSRRMRTLEPFLADAGLLGYFDLLVSPDHTENHKPNPEPAFFAMKKLNATPDRTVFIGDATFDIECGNAAGTDTVLVEWGGMNPEGWPVRPDLVVREFSELLP